MFVTSGAGVLKKVLLSRPTYLKPAPINEIAKLWKDSVLDVEKMEKEHELLADTYRANGVEVVYLEANENRPNAVFARDFGACVREGYILGSFKYELRLHEHIDYKAKMEELNIPVIARCDQGLFEGGDFMFLGDRYLVIGMADRSDEAGVAAIRAQLAPYGYEVLGIPLKPAYLHLDMCFNLVDDHLAVAYVDGMPEALLALTKRLGIELIAISEQEIFEHGCNLQALGNKRVISLKKNERVNLELKKRGMKVLALDIEEILKAGGGPHCMTFPLERA